MKISDQIIMCLQNLFRRKVRTLLTVSGVVIGTCAIVVMISLGVGMQASQDAMLAQMGDLTIIEVNNYSGRTETGETLVLDDAALRTIGAMEHVEVVTPFYNPSVWNAFTLCSGNGNRYQMDMYNIVGVYPEALEKLGYTLHSGSFLSTAQGDRIEILGGYYSSYDFRDTRKKRNNYVEYWRSQGDEMPKPYVDIEKDKLVIRINNTKENGKTLEVKAKGTGILEMDQSKGYETGYGIFISVTQLKELEAKYNKLNNIKTDSKTNSGYTSAKVKVTDMKYVEEVQSAIDAMGFNTYSMEDIRKPMQEESRRTQMTLGGLGAISLLVAALGIANTMVMSIYERTREIGVMKVLGCMVGNIRSIFLMEAGVIGFMGGVVGIIISYIISYLINVFGNGLTLGSSYYYYGADAVQTSIIPIWLVLVALVFSTLIGLVSGFYPANRAVKISALEAIKNE